MLVVFFVVSNNNLDTLLWELAARSVRRSVIIIQVVYYTKP